MTQREDELWYRICGTAHPNEFADDNAESIDAILREVIASHDDVSDDDGKIFHVLREAIRKDVGV